MATEERSAETAPIRWGTSGYLNLTKVQINDPIFMQELGSIHNEFKGFRCEIIEAALFIESRVEFLLGLFFCGRQDVVRLALFESLVLQHEFCSLNHKIRMLKDALKAWRTIEEEDRKSLATKLKKLMEERNFFAHGDLYVHAENKKVFIKMGSDYAEVTERMVKDALQRANEIHQQVELIISSMPEKHPNLF